jgi:hypothetical protein
MSQPLDPNETPGASEFSWGPGVQPKWAKNLPPDEGGMYKGKTPGEIRNKGDSAVIGNWRGINNG